MFVTVKQILFHLFFPFILYSNIHLGLNFIHVGAEKQYLHTHIAF